MIRQSLAFAALIALTLLPRTGVRAATTHGSPYPDASFFTLPSSQAGGPVTVKRLSPQAVASPVKPITRTEYDIAHTPLSYRIDVFVSATEAQTSLRDQVAQLPRNVRHYRVPLHLADQQVMYGLSGAYVLITLDRYIEIVAVADRAATLAPSVMPGGASTQLIHLSHLLLLRSRQWDSFSAGNTVPGTGNKPQDASTFVSHVVTNFGNCLKDTDVLTQDSDQLVAETQNGGLVDTRQTQADALVTFDDCARAQVTIAAVGIPASLAHDPDLSAFRDNAARAMDEFTSRARLLRKSLQEISAQQTNQGLADLGQSNTYYNSGLADLKTGISAEHRIKARYHLS